MANTNKKLLILSAILSLITTILIYKYLIGLQEPTQQDIAKVLVAVQDIPPRSIIVKEMVKEQMVPVEYIHSNAATSMDQVVGKITTETIVSNEQIILSRLAENKKSSLSFNIPKGKRAVTINANEVILVGNLVKPGDFVDILATLEEDEIETGSDVTVYPESTKIILQKIQVLAVGQEIYENSVVKEEIPKSITLAVSPEESEQLVLAEEIGKVRLILRSVLDEDTVTTPGAYRKDISTARGITVKKRSTQGGTHE